MEQHYRPEAIEAAAQRYWQENETFRAVEEAAGEKFYCLSMLPYPSGRLHMGHVRNYTIGDVIARCQRMQGRNVLQPMGWDAFGLPAENAALKNRVAPARWTYENIGQMREQLQRLGFGYDWSRELATCRPEYYRWEQWFFLRLLKKGLVYRKSSVVNWDPVDRTVLANEQVIDGKGWRSGAVVERREIPQWFFRITAYAEELLEGLERLDGWPNAVRAMQRNWIGRSEGVELEFASPDGDPPLSVYTTRPDTLMGATYIAVAAEHPLARRAAEEDAALAAFLAECRAGGSAEAIVETQEKRGMPLGLHLLHPISGAAIPVWVANFVLMGYGSGAVMAVPAHDQRDWEFACKYGLPIRQVIRPADDAAIDLETAAFTAPGITLNSAPFDDLTSQQAFDAIADRLAQDGRGRRTINYRLRDWGVSRQRYWGCPIPVVHCPACGVAPVAEADLPVALPETLADAGELDAPGGSPLKQMRDWVETRCPQCGGAAERETDTFDTFMESSWYFLRYACRDQDEAMIDERADAWCPVDQYIGGVEHAILHLLYARFYHKLLRDEGLLHSDEPFTRLLTQGMVLKDGAKMSKSRGNTVDPQAMIDRYGADTVRLFMMFAAPPEQTLEWSEAGVEGAWRFLKRVWRLVWTHVESGGGARRIDPTTLNETQRTLRRTIHQTIAKASDDLFRRHMFNTAIAAVMELVNALARDEDDGSDAARALRQEGLETVALLLSPITPHICHALWRALGHTQAIIEAPWPTVDAAALEQTTQKLVVQVNGRVRSEIVVPTNAPRETIEAAALADAKAQRFIADKPVRRVIFVPGRLVNVVV